VGRGVLTQAWGEGAVITSQEGDTGGSGAKENKELLVLYGSPTRHYMWGGRQEIPEEVKLGDGNHLGRYDSERE